MVILNKAIYLVIVQCQRPESLQRLMSLSKLVRFQGACRIRFSSIASDDRRIKAIPLQTIFLEAFFLRFELAGTMIRVLFEVDIVVIVSFSCVIFMLL